MKRPVAVRSAQQQELPRLHGAATRLYVALVASTIFSMGTKIEVDAHGFRRDMVPNFIISFLRG